MLLSKFDILCSILTIDVNKQVVGNRCEDILRRPKPHPYHRIMDPNKLRIMLETFFVAISGSIFFVRCI